MKAHNLVRLFDRHDPWASNRHTTMDLEGVAPGMGIPMLHVIGRVGAVGKTIFRCGRPI